MKTKRLIRSQEVGQHAGISEPRKNLKGWVNMQEWWVNMNRNGGSTWSGMYSHDHSTLNAINHHCTFNPFNKIVELYEALVKSEREKVEMLQRRLDEKK